MTETVFVRALLGGSLLACAHCASPPPPAARCPEPAPAAVTPPLASAPSSMATNEATASDASTRTPPRAKGPPRAPTAVLYEPGVSEDGFLPRAEAQTLGIDGEALDAMITEAEKTQSDSLIVLKDGKTIVERYFGKKRRRIETMSVTKSFAAIAVALLVSDGKIASFDAPLGTWFPEFAKDERAAITVRHVLTQTTGLEHVSSAREINRRNNRLRFARSRKAEKKPGETFSYNNSATQLLSGVIETAAGERVDKLLARRLFSPLGITDWQWDRDGAGNVQTYYGLALHARDLAKVGELMLRGGRWNGEAVLPAEVVRSLTHPSEANPYYGLLWWLRYQRVVAVQRDRGLQALREAGFGHIQAMKPMSGRKFSGPPAYWMETGRLLEPPARAELARLAGEGVTPFEEEPDDLVGFYADGWLGQKLAVFPSANLVVARQHRRIRGDEAENQSAGFRTILKMSQKLVAR